MRVTGKSGLGNVLLLLGINRLIRLKLPAIRVQFVEQVFDVLAIDVALPLDVADQLADFAAVAGRQQDLLLLRHLKGIQSLGSYTSKLELLPPNGREMSGA